MGRDDGPGWPTGDFRVTLRELTEADEDEFLRVARASASLHHPWYSTASTPEEFRAYLTRLSRPTTEGRVVCVRDDGAMAGLVTLDTIVRGRLLRRRRQPT
jgi:[ribosomal protein S5]-alanine N-acetyltransferase